MKLLSTLVIAAALTISGAASADVFKDNGCIVCHDATAKKIGPTWKDVAAKLKGNKDAEKIVAETLAKGITKPTMGKVPMPPQPKAVPNAKALFEEIMKH
jgi:cytochrome c